MLSGIITGVLLLLFIGVCIWAFSPRRRRDFDAASRLPLDDDRIDSIDDEEKRR
jgi:cytochrome c oxidase cbb3-type subunit 4